MIISCTLALIITFCNQTQETDKEFYLCTNDIIECLYNEVDTLEGCADIWETPSDKEYEYYCEENNEQ